ncbi:MAG: hypothetical protein R2778_01565 [Saprospiraceae bacterium]
MFTGIEDGSAGTYMASYGSQKESGKLYSTATNYTPLPGTTLKSSSGLFS